MKKYIVIVFIISFLLTLVVGNILSNDSEKIGGDSISGYRENGMYYILISKTEYKEVDSIIWIRNFVLWIATFAFGLIAAISMVISLVVYFLIPFYSKT